MCLLVILAWVFSTLKQSDTVALKESDTIYECMHPLFLAHLIRNKTLYILVQNNSVSCLNTFPKYGGPCGIAVQNLTLKFTESQDVIEKITKEQDYENCTMSTDWDSLFPVSFNCSSFGKEEHRESRKENLDKSKQILVASMVTSACLLLMMLLIITIPCERKKDKKKCFSKSDGAKRYKDRRTLSESADSKKTASSTKPTSVDEVNNIINRNADLEAEKEKRDFENYRKEMRRTFPEESDKTQRRNVESHLASSKGSGDRSDAQGGSGVSHRKS